MWAKFNKLASSENNFADWYQRHNIYSLFWTESLVSHKGCIRREI